MGCQLISMPEDDLDALRLVTHTADSGQDFHVPMLAIHQLTKSDLVWVTSLGAFRTVYLLVRHASSSPLLLSHFMPYILPVPLICWLTCLAHATAKL